MQDLRAIFESQQARMRADRAGPSLAGRRAALERLRAEFGRHEREVVTALAQDFAKPETEVMLTEILPVRRELALALRHLRRWARARRVSGGLLGLGTRAFVRREPRGVCLILSPWNYPVNLALGPLISCLAAGNRAIVKPSELAPASSAVVAKILRAAFGPDEVAVAEGGVEVATQLLALPFDHIFFTGSPAVGKVVMRAAAEHLSSVTLELGGKSPVIVGPGADLAQAAKWIAFGKFTNAGQTCIAPDHVYVHAGVHEKFLTHLKAATEAGFGGGRMAGLISPRHAARQRALLEEARATGAGVIAGGEAGERLGPTILGGIIEGTALAQEEIFGPLLPVIPYQDSDAVLAEINARPKPLALYVFDKDPAFAERVIARTSSGGVGVNLTVLQFSHEGLPFGGVNHSGLGAAHGEWGFLAFSHERAVLKNHFSPLPMIFPPYSGTKRRLIALARRLLG